MSVKRKISAAILFAASLPALSQWIYTERSDPIKGRVKTYSVMSEPVEINGKIQRAELRFSALKKVAREGWVIIENGEFACWNNSCKLTAKFGNSYTSKLAFEPPPDMSPNKLYAVHPDHFIEYLDGIDMFWIATQIKGAGEVTLEFKVSGLVYP